MFKAVKEIFQAYRDAGRIEAERVRQVVAEQWDEIYHDPDSHVEGNPKGDVTLVIFFDYH